MLESKISLLPKEPGCYLMKNSNGIIIYIGKAKNLKSRVTSYFRGTHTGKTAKLVSEIIDFEYIAVTSEKESLILELNLIKKYDPKYNILLRDDKSYPYIEFTKEKDPRILVVRNINKKKKHTRMFGPYPNVMAAREVVNLLNRMYPLRKCRTYPKKPCLYYHINQCLGYCVYDINSEIINQMELEILRFLNGDHSMLTKKIKSEMINESTKMRYENAKELKELLDFILVTLDKQKVEIKDEVDRDVLGYYIDKGYLSLQVFFIRGGKIVERHKKILPMVDEVKEELERYMVKFYERSALLPKELLVPSIIDDKLLSSVLGISVKTPSRGVKNELILMARENSKKMLSEEFELIQRDEAKTVLANAELQNLLGMNKLDRIELFDNSNLFGTFNVSGMVVFVDGKPYKNGYRKFKISIDKNDDYGTMKEVIYRRYFRVLKDNEQRPDLIIVDGGLGQINVARSVLEDLNMNIPVIGLKKDNKHTTNALLAGIPVIELKIDKRTNLFHYLERMQAEVHEYTINYHKKLRSKGSLASILDLVPGIGEKRKKELLKKYKTITKLKELSIEEINNILPEKVSIELYNFLKDYKGE